MSIGTGKIIVLLFSADILFRVCRYLNYNKNSILSCPLIQYRFCRSYFNVGLIGTKLLFYIDYILGIVEVGSRRMCSSNYIKIILSLGHNCLYAGKILWVFIHCKKYDPLKRIFK